MIQEKIIAAIRVSKRCKASLQLALDKSAVTIQRYIDENDIMLETDTAIKVITEHLGFSREEILIEQKV